MWLRPAVCGLLVTYDAMTDQAVKFVSKVKISCPKLQNHIECACVITFWFSCIWQVEPTILWCFTWMIEKMTMQKTAQDVKIIRVSSNKGWPKSWTFQKKTKKTLVNQKNKTTFTLTTLKDVRVKVPLVFRFSQF